MVPDLAADSEGFQRVGDTSEGNDCAKNCGNQSFKVLNGRNRPIALQNRLLRGQLRKNSFETTISLILAQF